MVISTPLLAQQAGSHAGVVVGPRDRRSRTQCAAGDGDRARLERYVRESMTDWAVRCPRRVVAGAPLHVSIDATTARSALHSTMHVVVDDAWYFVDDRLRAASSEPRNGPVMRQPSARFAAPTEPGTYTLTVEARVGRGPHR